MLHEVASLDARDGYAGWRTPRAPSPGDETLDPKTLILNPGHHTRLLDMTASMRMAQGTNPEPKNPQP